MAKEFSHTVPETEHGIRLDACIARTGGFGIRKAKRLIADGNVLVDGKIRPPHCKLEAGSCVTVRETEPVTVLPVPRLAAANKDYLAFIKPPGIHTAHIAGGNAPSLERSIASRWETIRSTTMVPENVRIPNFLAPLLPPLTEDGGTGCLWPPDPPELLSRLDAATSGLVAAAATPEAAARFKALEVAGSVTKCYLAVVHGAPAGRLVIRNRLDTDNRKKTRVLPESSPDGTRHTELHPLGAATAFSIPEADETMCLAAVFIKRGARHQIRAHLAHAGFPLIGDPLYGPADSPFSLRLHHACLAMPGFSAFCLPPWLNIP
ncbi:MAG: RNA pseudouridine synthase [Deltaproteobacteria bacterium]|nr:RNA pseudouridine synthase [Deltaproteobacteria bacterium]